MGSVERKVFLIRPERNKEPVAYVNIPAEVKKFYVVEQNGRWYGSTARVVFDEETGIMMVIPKWIETKVMADAATVKAIVEKAMVASEEEAVTEKVRGEKESGREVQGEEESGREVSGEVRKESGRRPLVI